jgi:DNA-binding response OmpR family regulator
MATILVIDAERLICDLLSSVFSVHGHEVVTATDGREGLKLFRQKKPGFTLLDLDMPGMNSIEVLEQIRADDPRAQVIVLTGGAIDSREIQARGLGVTEFLRKGLPLEALVKTMDKVMARSSQAAEATADPSKRVSLLVVDDEEPIRSLLSRFLTLRGYRVRVAKEGQEALTLVAQESPQMVITDIYMPVMNGIELIRELKARKYAGGIMVMTNSQDTKKLQKMLDLGAVDVLGKPVDLDRLELVVQVGCILSAQ